MSIEVQQIHKRFGDYLALDDVSLQFPAGQLTALLGPSGCGKTTLLRIIAGLESPDSGRIFLGGELASHKHVRERRVGFVFQHYALFRHMTVFDNIAFGIRMKPRSERPSETLIKDKVHQLLQLVQLDWLANRFPDQLSGGQRQRIALARALAIEPTVLLLDEPFGALDAKVRRELRRWLRRLHDELHMTSIFVTHDQEEALEVSDQVVLMNQGHIEQVGSPEDVYRQPASPFVYSFLGNVNLFQAKMGNKALLIGKDTVPYEENSFTTGTEVSAYIRPHEMEIITDPQSGIGITSRVTRILAFGMTTRVELETPVQDQEPTLYEVEITNTQAEQLKLETGQTIRVLPSKPTLFKHPHKNLPADFNQVDPL